MTHIPRNVGYFLFNSLRKSFVPDVNIFVIAAALQNDFHILIAFDAEKQTLLRLYTFAVSALFEQDLHIFSLFGKACMRNTKRKRIIIIIADTEILHARKKSEIKDFIL